MEVIVDVYGPEEQAMGSYYAISPLQSADDVGVVGMPLLTHL